MISLFSTAPTASYCHNNQLMNDATLPGVPKSGRFGGWVYYVVGGKQRRRRYIKPKDPRTPKQLASRAAFAGAVGAAPTMVFALVYAHAAPRFDWRFDVDDDGAESA